MISRRDCIQRLGTIGLMGSLTSMNSIEPQILKRVIPSTGELLPAIGLGTWRVFDVGGSEQEQTSRKNVLKALYENNGRVVDSSPMYGQSESTVGDLSTELKLNQSFFFATKVWTSGLENGKRQIDQSFQRFKRQEIDLLQIHNVLDWQTHLPTLQNLKAEGRIRYIGVTHYTDGMHSTLAEIVKKHKLDFVQVNYNLGDRHAEQELFSVAQQNGVAVIINRPFEEGALFRVVRGKTLPEWTAEFDCKTWAQFFLKFVISHPAVTATIPGTSDASHMAENIQAAFGKLPDPSQRKKMIELFESL